MSNAGVRGKEGRAAPGMTPTGLGSSIGVGIATAARFAAAGNDKGHPSVPLILWAWQLVIVCQVQLGCYPESRMPLSGTLLWLGEEIRKSTLLNLKIPFRRTVHEPAGFGANMDDKPSADATPKRMASN